MDGGGDRRVERLLDAVLAIAGDLELETILERIVEAACELVHARYGALGVISEQGTRLSAFVHHGIDADTAAKIGELPEGRGILGVLIEHPTPLRLEDLAQHADSYGFPPNHPTMRAFLGVPVHVRGEVFGNLYLTEKLDGSTFTPDDEALLIGLAAVAGTAIQHARLFAEARTRDQWRDAVLEVSASVVGQASVVGHPSGTGGRPRVAELGAGLVGADGAVLAEAHDEGVWVLATVGDAPPEGFLEVEDAAVATVLADGQPQRVGRGRVFGRAELWVPVQEGTEVVGALGVARATPFGPSEEQLLAAFCSQVSVAWTHARAQREVHRLSLLQDRERIGRDLHDTVIQRLFATGLSLQATIRRADADPELRRRLERAVDDIDETVREIRSTIFALQRRDEAGRGVRSRVLEVIEEVAPSLPRAPRVRFDGPIDTVVTDRVIEHLLPVVRETLTNVARHAYASDVEVELRADQDGVLLRVADDGRGMPDAPGGGLGLANLRQRAHALDGELRIGTRSDGSGTVVVWELPAS